MERYKPCVFDSLNLICDNSFFSGVICDNSNLSFDSLNLISNNSKFCAESSNFHSSTWAYKHQSITGAYARGPAHAWYSRLLFMVKSMKSKLVFVAPSIRSFWCKWCKPSFVKLNYLLVSKRRRSEAWTYYLHALASYLVCQSHHIILPSFMKRISQLYKIYFYLDIF
jgi:hypothetical protein